MGLNSRTKNMAAQVCAQAKSPKKASNGLYFMTTGDQRPHHSVAKPWSRCRSGVSRCSNAGCVHVNMESRSYASCRGKDLSCSTTRATGCTYKSRGMLPGGDQTVAVIANDESLQVRVRKGTPPRREVNSAPFGAQRCQNGASLRSRSAASLQKVVCCVQGPCETGETLDFPSMISVPLCTKVEMSDINSGN